MEDQDLFLSLLEKYVQSTITSSERDEFFRLLITGSYDDLLERHMLSINQMDQSDETSMPASRAEEVMQRIMDAEKQASVITRPISTIRKKLIGWSVAASIIGIIIFASYLLLKNTPENKKVAVAVIPESFMGEKENNTSSPIRFQLEDGSFVTLKPLSRLHYPTHFAAVKREVYLEGEAFFEVSKNPSRPFLVYYDNLVTHVLGTSFNVKTDKAKHLVEVSVVTGKVQVYENKNLMLPGNNKKEANGVILTPNQKVVYKEDNRQFTATLVSDPAPIAGEPSHPQIKTSDFVFKETPLKDVLTLLEKN